MVSKHHRYVSFGHDQYASNKIKIEKEKESIGKGDIYLEKSHQCAF